MGTRRAHYAFTSPRPSASFRGVLTSANSLAIPRPSRLPPEHIVWAQAAPGPRSPISGRWASCPSPPLPAAVNRFLWSGPRGPPGQHAPTPRGRRTREQARRSRRSSEPRTGWSAHPSSSCRVCGKLDSFAGGPPAGPKPCRVWVWGGAGRPPGAWGGGGRAVQALPVVAGLREGPCLSPRGLPEGSHGCGPGPEALTHHGLPRSNSPCLETSSPGPAGSGRRPCPPVCPPLRSTMCGRGRCWIPAPSIIRSTGLPR